MIVIQRHVFEMATLYFPQTQRSYSEGEELSPELKLWLLTCPASHYSTKERKEVHRNCNTGSSYGNKCDTQKSISSLPNPIYYYGEICSLQCWLIGVDDEHDT